MKKLFVFIIAIACITTTAFASDAVELIPKPDNIKSIGISNSHSEILIDYYVVNDSEENSNIIKYLAHYFNSIEKVEGDFDYSSYYERCGVVVFYPNREATTFTIYAKPSIWDGDGYGYCDLSVPMYQNGRIMTSEPSDGFAIYHLEYNFTQEEYDRIKDFIYNLNKGNIVLEEDVTYDTSQWATEYVNTAVEKGLVPKWNQINYKGKINRVEVCQLIDNLLENKGYNAEREAENPFEDTTDSAVISLYDKGIINGKSKTAFCPYEYITREEFAKILSETYLYMNSSETLQNGEYEFADAKEISDWAVEYVGHTKSLGLMIGNENNEFKPKDNITKEEVIVTLLRLND